MRHRRAQFSLHQNRVIYIAGLYRYTELRVAVTEFSNRVMVKLELLPGTPSTPSYPLDDFLGCAVRL